jgi:Lon protease-like protein
MHEQSAPPFPLFPLGIVALPGEAVPLHIFEDRYKRMIRACLEDEAEAQGGEFGIVWLSEDELKPVGCACAVERVLQRYDDGRLDILARGKRPFRLLERRDEEPYPAGTVEFLADRHEEPDPEQAGAARELYAQLVEQATDRRPAADQLGRLSAYDIAGVVEFGCEAKQELLELRSENARLRLLALLLRAAIKRLELVERAQARASSNGRVRFA